MELNKRNTEELFLEDLVEPIHKERNNRKNTKNINAPQQCLLTVKTLKYFFDLDNQLFQKSSDLDFKVGAKLNYRRTATTLVDNYKRRLTWYRGNVENRS